MLSFIGSVVIESVSLNIKSSLLFKECIISYILSLILFSVSVSVSVSFTDSLLIKSISFKDSLSSSLFKSFNSNKSSNSICFVFVFVSFNLFCKWVIFLTFSFVNLIILEFSFSFSIFICFILLILSALSVFINDVLFSFILFIILLYVSSLCFCWFKKIFFKSSTFLFNSVISRCLLKCEYNKYKQHKPIKAKLINKILELILCKSTIFNNKFNSK